MTKIEWTDETWNVVHGCDRVSAGCDHCYAMSMAKRLKAMGEPGYQRDGAPATSGPGFAVTLRPERLGIPLRWTRPRRVFVCSMADLFHDAVPDDYIAQVFAVMAASTRHTYQVLTKRHGRVRSLLSSSAFIELVRATPLVPGGDPNPHVPWPLPNVWLGVSTEDQHWADIRIPALLATPAAVRWISAEPLLGPLDLSAGTGRGRMTPVGLDWVVVGGESGRLARPMHPDWARDLRDQCETTGVPFLFKQWGEWAPDGAYGIGNGDARQMYVRPLRPVPPPYDDGWGISLSRVGKKAAGRELDGRTHDGYPLEVSA